MEHVVVTESKMQYPNGDIDIINARHFSLLYSTALMLSSNETRDRIKWQALKDEDMKYLVNPALLNYKIGFDAFKFNNGTANIVGVSNITNISGGALSAKTTVLNTYGDLPEDREGLIGTTQELGVEFSFLLQIGFPDLCSKALIGFMGDQILDGKGYAICFGRGNARNKFKYIHNHATKEDMMGENEEEWSEYMYRIEYNSVRYRQEYKQLVGMVKSQKKYQDIDESHIEFTDDKKLENTKKYYAPMCNGCYGNYNMYVHVFDATPCILHIFRCPFLFFKYVAATVSSWIVRERNEWIKKFKTANKYMKLSQKEIDKLVPAFIRFSSIRNTLQR
eukprot:59846_1